MRFCQEEAFYNNKSTLESAAWTSVDLVEGPKWLYRKQPDRLYFIKDVP